MVNLLYLTIPVCRGAELSGLWGVAEAAKRPEGRARTAPRKTAFSRRLNGSAKARSP